MSFYVNLSENIKEAYFLKLYNRLLTYCICFLCLNKISYNYTNTHWNMPMFYIWKIYNTHEKSTYVQLLQRYYFSNVPKNRMYLDRTFFYFIWSIILHFYIFSQECVIFGRRHDIYMSANQDKMTNSSITPLQKSYCHPATIGDHRVGGWYVGYICQLSNLNKRIKHSVWQEIFCQCHTR